MDKSCVSISTHAHPHRHRHTQIHKYTHTHAVSLSRLGHSSPEEPSKPDQNPYWPAAVLTRSQLRHEKEEEKESRKDFSDTTWFELCLPPGSTQSQGCWAACLTQWKPDVVAQRKQLEMLGFRGQRCCCRVLSERPWGVTITSHNFRKQDYTVYRNGFFIVTFAWWNTV